MNDFFSIFPFIILASAQTAVIGGAILWTYRASGYLNILHGFFFVTGGILFSLILGSDAVNGLTAFIVTLIAVGALSVAVELFLFRPLRLRGAGPVTLLLGSFAAFIVGENILALVTANATMAPAYSIGWTIAWLDGFSLNSLQLSYVLVALILLVSGELLLMSTTAGIVLRAISENPELAAVSRVPEKAIVAVSAFGSGALSAFAGIFIVLDVGLTATDGMSAAIAGAVAAIFGGMRRLSGVALGAFFVAGLNQSGVYFLGAQWQNLVTYAALAVVLYFARNRLFGGGIYTW